MKKLIPVVLVVIILVGCESLGQRGFSSDSDSLLNASSRQPWQLDNSVKFLEMRVTELETKVSDQESRIAKLESEVKKLR